MKGLLANALPPHVPAPHQTHHLVDATPRYPVPRTPSLCCSQLPRFGPKKDFSQQRESALVNLGVSDRQVASTLKTQNVCFVQRSVFL